MRTEKEIKFMLNQFLELEKIGVSNQAIISQIKILQWILGKDFNSIEKNEN